ncbi:ABC transporter ATP-binding protein [Terrisporobacter sp.]|uniref:ABC transporter ATP-binding protein n=1 Tax=Terrisporobacter sp. TaxID=1965305 RepID=UPI002602EC88|nr:ABC transporter ATP-binding protein [Terrisporobacter sp.]
MEVINNVIVAKNVNKVYEASKFKIENLNLIFKEGQITGLVGKNGSGKTTIMKMMVGLLPIDNGEVRILNKDISDGFNSIKNNIGYMHAEHYFYEYLTGREFLFFVGKIKGLEEALIDKRIREYSEYFELKSLLDTTIINYSHGTKQKISFISQIINNPSILLLDEPLNGLDPVIIKKIREFIKKISIENGTCVIVSAHQLSFIEEICDRVIVINDGKIIMDKEISSSNLKVFENDILHILKNGAINNV